MLIYDFKWTEKLTIPIYRNYLIIEFIDLIIKFIQSKYFLNGAIKGEVIYIIR